MFDFAISQNQKKRLTRRGLICWMTSCIAHFLALLLFLQYPELLAGGMYHRFRAIPLLSHILGPESNDETENWRTIAVLDSKMSMMAPSAATLKKYIYDFKKGKQSPPVQVRWGDAREALANLPPMPRVKQKVPNPDLALPANPLASAPSENIPDAAAASAAGSEAAASDSGTGKKETVNLPAPEPAPSPEASINNPPTQIPDSIKPPAQPAPKPAEAMKVFEDEQKAIRSQESGFFDTQGFPLGEYASLIVERVKGKWFIPSSLKNSRGRTTVVFYIDKSGRYTNARIVASSGSNTFDNSALMAIIESNPFPPLPKGFPGDQVGAKFVFSYNEP